MDSKSNRLFGAFFCLSLFLHYFVITAVPVEKLLKTGTQTLADNSAKESDTVTIEFELESPPEDSNVNAEEEASLQEKRLFFVDTSDNPIDEEPQGDSDKIGVKGTVARDTYEGEDADNNQPHLEGNSTGLFLTEGISPFVETPSEDSEGQDEPMELTNNNLPGPVLEQSEGTESQLNETEAVASLPQSTDEPHPTEEDSQQEEKEGDSDEDKEGLEHVEDPTLLAQLEYEIPDLFLDGVEEMDSIETPLELEDEGEIVPLVTPPQRKKMRQESEARHQSPLSEKTQDSRPRTQTPSGKKINRGAKRGSPVIYEDTISNAPIHGKESFSVQRHEYAEYFQHIRDKIAWYWFLSYGHDQSIKLETKNRLPIIVKFKVLPSGNMGDVEIIDEAGNSLLAARIQQAIQATQLNSFPPYIEEEFIDVKFNFYFF